MNQTYLGSLKGHLNSMKHKTSSKAKAWRVRGKGSEEVGEVSSPLGIRSYKEFGFCPKGKEKLLKGFVQEHRTDMCMHNFVCVGLSEAGIM